MSVEDFCMNFSVSNKMFYPVLLAVLVVSSYLCGAKHVVMIPAPIKSYLIYHAKVGHALTELGHKVSICVPDYLVNKGLVPNKAISIIKYGKQLGDIEAYIFNKTNIIAGFWAGEVPSIGNFGIIINTFKEVVNKILSEEAFITSIRDMKPDFLILESFIFTRNLIVLPYKLDIPFGLIGPSQDSLLNRVPFNSASETFFFENGSDRKTFLERVKAVVASAILMAYDPFTDADIVTRYAPDKPYTTIREIALKAEISIAETDHILDYPQSTLPNTRRVGGFSVSDAKPLPQDIQSFVERSSRGVAVVSFGGGDIKVPYHIKSKMATAFHKLDLNIVWKTNWSCEKEDNILALNWIPQNDLLGHPKTQVFVSHCGTNGQYEALYHGVPILCLPIFGDQFYNANRIYVKGFGLYADIRDITPEKLTQLIQQVANDSKYRSNIQKASQIFKELHKVPNKEAAYWFDHVMKYGGDYMRSSGQQIPLYQFLLIDVIAFLLAVVIVFTLVVCLILRMCCRRFKKSKLKTA
ncbi:UDP-glucuronosyltransferase 2A3-like isoform X1 [Biomphalaria pfeifferi]|uniref:UDP-glucuronosyltransferase n=1 Tax=Biomphalaria pfeifferi TaxID=112525 RepID=A0AAD8B8W6_BIOPF|nr:UDP-glucuronosyltransferase 2A3-like isoform X1 [Biomphalaria pfeifferi]